MSHKDVPQSAVWIQEIAKIFHDDKTERKKAVKTSLDL